MVEAFENERQAREELPALLAVEEEKLRKFAAEYLEDVPEDADAITLANLLARAGFTAVEVEEGPLAPKTKAQPEKQPVSHDPAAQPSEETKGVATLAALCTALGLTQEEATHLSLGKIIRTCAAGMSGATAESVAAEILTTNNLAEGMRRFGIPGTKQESFAKLLAWVDSKRMAKAAAKNSGKSQKAGAAQKGKGGK